MPQDDELKPSEIIIRVLLRVPADMMGPSARPNKDLKDFIRRKSYGKSGQPENGISVFRKSKFKSSQEIYDRIGSAKKLMGLAECAFEAVLAKHLKHKVTGDRGEHISLRCNDCDMVGLGAGICKPATGENFESCPFFGPDVYDLDGVFKEVEAPSLRILSKKGSPSA